MFQATTEQKMHYTLRIAAAMCFIGHGAFGIITKPIWCNYFAVFGMGHDTAYTLMPVLGSVDILLGLVLLFYPVRAVAGWLVIWGIVTASLRPLSGEPFAEFIERAGNYGAPLVLLILGGGLKQNVNGWFTPVTPNTTVTAKMMAQAIFVLRVTGFLLLLGHGWLNVIEKKTLIGQYTALGFVNPVMVAHIAGTFEILAACTVFIKPIRHVLIIFLIWKAGTELFYPHWELFEWVERGGSYGCILALWFALKPVRETKTRMVTANA